MIVIKAVKVIEVISDTNIGGAGKLLLNRIENSNKNRFKYTVILPRSSMLSNLLKETGVNIIEINGCKDKSFDIRTFIELYKNIKKISPDIINSHACLTARLVGKIADVDLNLYTRHCDFPVKKIYSFKKIVNIVKWFNICLNDGVIAVSESAKRNLIKLGVPPKMIKVIVNGSKALKGISCDEKKKIRAGLNIPADAIVVSIFARLESYKDHKTLLRAAKVLQKNHKIYFLIVGSGSLEEKLKKYADKLGVKKRVIFLGFINDVSKIMNITDINVNCSIGTETSSLALSEGMSLSVPAIASDYLGNKYIVKDRVNGLIYHQKDYKELADKILLLSRDKKLYTYLSENAKKRFCDELNAKRMTEETEKYYLSLLKKKRSIKHFH